MVSFEQRETMAELNEQTLKAGGASQGYTGVYFENVHTWCTPSDSMN